MMKKGVLSWNIDELSRAMQIAPADVKLYFRDGRKVSFILERRLACEVINGRLAPSEGAGYDLLDSDGGKWEVRSISKSGIYFCPSYMVGSGRKFDERGFIAKIDEIKGYIVSDIQSFPNIPYWTLPAEQVATWWENGLLGTTTKIPRYRAIKLVTSLYDSHTAPR